MCTKELGSEFQRKDFNVQLVYYSDWRSIRSSNSNGFDALFSDDECYRILVLISITKPSAVVNGGKPKMQPTNGESESINRLL
jgi:hypothetical protein